MKSYASKLVRKDLSRSIYKNGISLSEYFSKTFDPTHNHNFNITLNDLKSIISNDESIIFQINPDNKEIIKLIPTYFKSKEYFENEEELYNYAYTKNLFEEEKNFNALSIYKVIMDSEEITYAQISKHLKDISENKINLDLKQVAHYCKELKKYNLVIVKVKSTKNNERVVVKNKVIDMYSDVNNKFDFTNREDSEDSQSNHEEENQIDENLFHALDNKNFYKFSKDPEKIMEMTKEEKTFLQIKNQMNMNKNYLENRFSFYVDEICIENNILFHLLVKKEKGLTINEITFLLGLHGREKTTNRILSNMEKKNLIKHMNIRKGKKYEFCYLLREDVMNKIPKNILSKHENYLNRKSKTENQKEILNTVESQVLENLNIPSDTLTKTNKFEETAGNKNLSNSESTGLINFTNFNSAKSEDKSAKSTNRNSFNNLDSFLNLAKGNKNNQINQSIKIENTLDISRNNETKNKSAEFKCPIKENNIKPALNYQDLNMTDFKFIMDEIISNPNLQKIKNNHKLNTSTNFENISLDAKRRILLDYFNAHLQLFKIKSINDVSYNRYIFTLNKINQNKFITVNELKVFILNELEKTIGFVIDRRTIKNLFINLEKLGLIKTLEFELTMRNKLYNYMKNSEITQKKIVSISREIEVTDDVIEKLQEILVTRHTKATSSEIFFNDQKLTKYDEDDEEDMMESMNLNKNTLNKANLNMNVNSDYNSEEKKFEDFIKNSDQLNIKENLQNSLIHFKDKIFNPLEIKEEINILTSNLNLNISYNQKNILKLLDQITPLQEKYIKKFSKEFLENLKKFYFVKENLHNLFSKKSKNYANFKFNSEEDESTDKLPLHKIFSNSSLEKVIVPRFLKDKFLKLNCNSQEIENKQKTSMTFEKNKTIDSYFEDEILKEEFSDNNNNIVDLITQRNFEFNSNQDEKIYNYQMIDYFNMDKHTTNFLKNSKLNFSLNNEEQKFAKKYFKTGLDFKENSELKSFMEKKRERDVKDNKNLNENYLTYLSKLPLKNITKKDKRFNSAHYKKILDLVPLLRKIYFNPKIKIKRLSNLLPTFTVSSDILLYLNKLGILKMTRDERNIEDNFKNNFYSWEIMRNDVSLELDEKSHLFFDI